ncbi:MAG: type I-U CRISPR-associated protein Cas5/Cas6 [Verrucomicrobia bacterium]|nr:type I-U CRISPR-associated protein Cas5/Cas6 [Verrucomicrobiota bacterium]MBI3868370.1 type I-U CRISPR-associated protein Cas5/Cas6 [Verrucomicrobiota bacterium]
MLILGIRYLQGVAVASHGEYGRVEWPPHPARVFMAMVAAHYQTGADLLEREALLWLERQAPPEIYAPEALPCRVVTQYVPVNDKTGPSKAHMHSLPLTRHRSDRPPFARASLASDTVMLHWLDPAPTQLVRDALSVLCGKITRIGHSSSLVQVWLADSIAPDLQRWATDESRGTHQFRVTREGTLQEVLDASFNGEAVARYCDLKVREAKADDSVAAAGKGHEGAKAEMKAAKEANADKSAQKAAKDATRIAKEALDEAKALKLSNEQALDSEFPHGEPRQDRPRISTYASYARAEEITGVPPKASSVFSPHLTVFTLERDDGPYRSLDLACTLALTDRWREAMASHANDFSLEAQALLTGHAPDKSVLQTAHVAFLPLGFVGHSHADGRMPGVALALPAEMSAAVRTDVLCVAACVRELKLGRLGAWKLVPSMARQLETLRPITWTAHPEGATQWSTVTPIAYDHHPKAKAKAEYLAEVAAMITAGCGRIGLPRPREVIPTPVSTHVGAPAAHAFPRLRRKDGSERRHTHAILLFDEPVRGPVIIGAGRYRGYGLCRPMEVNA